MSTAELSAETRLAPIDVPMPDGVDARCQITPRDQGRGNWDAKLWCKFRITGEEYRAVGPNRDAAIDMALGMARRWFANRQAFASRTGVHRHVAELSKVEGSIQSFQKSGAWRSQPVECPEEDPQEDAMTATARKRKRKESPDWTPKHNIAVTFNSVTIGETTANVGFKVAREDIDLELADELFCGRRLSGKLTVIRGEEDARQKPLKGMEEDKPELSGSFDVKRFGCTPKQFTASAVFALAEVDLDDLGHFSKRNGRLLIHEVSELADAESSDEDGEDGDDDGDEE